MLIHDPYAHTVVFWYSNDIPLTTYWLLYRRQNYGNGVTHENSANHLIRYKGYSLVGSEMLHKYLAFQSFIITHCHTGVRELVNIGSDNGSSPKWRQATI